MFQIHQHQHDWKAFDTSERKQPVTLVDPLGERNAVTYAVLNGIKQNIKLPPTEAEYDMLWNCFLFWTNTQLS